MKLLLFTLISLLSFGCSDSVTKQKNSKEVSSTNTEKKSEIIDDDIIEYPTISIDFLKKLSEETSGIDIIFDELPISMSITEKSSIRGNVAYLSKFPAKIRKTDKPIGTVIFQTEGEITAEFDFYFNEFSQVWLLKENNKIIGGNQLTPSGINFFNKAFASIKKH